MQQAWIAARLHMRSAANVSQQIRRFEQQLQRKVLFSMQQNGVQTLLMGGQACVI
jgi:DNA-binding transcriptional LysR family regulator